MEDNYREVLLNHGLKATMQRLIILDYLKKSKEHPTAEMIYNALHKQYPTITLSTIYNTVEVLAEKGIIKKVSSPEGIIRYDGDTDIHHHIIDVENNKIIDLYDERLTKMIQDYLKERNLGDFEVLDFQVEVRVKPKK